MQIVGVVDPDSAGGDVGAIAARALQLLDEGAHLVDIDTVAGGVRPLDLRRLVRLVGRLVDDGVPVCVTTTSADIVVGSVDAGARVVCDPSGGVLDRFMPQIVAAAGVEFVLGQSVARLRAMRPATPWEFRDLAERRVTELLESGVAAELIVLDSGVGQIMRGDAEWGILEHLQHLAGSGHPVFVDASWPALFPPGSASLEAADEGDDDATEIGVCAVAASANAWGVRVSNVARAAAVLSGPSVWSRHGEGAHTR